MPYTSQRELNRQQALSQSLTSPGRNKNYGNWMSALAQGLNGYTAGKLGKEFGEREEENQTIEQQEMAELLKRSAPGYEENRKAGIVDALRNAPEGQLMEPGDAKNYDYQSPMAQQLSVQSQMDMNLAQQKAALVGGQHKDISRHKYYMGLNDADRQSFRDAARPSPYEYGLRSQAQEDVKTDKITENSPLEAAAAAESEKAVTDVQTQAITDQSSPRALAAAATEKAVLAEQLLSKPGLAQIEADKQRLLIKDKAWADAEVELSDYQSSLPHLKTIASDLSKLGKKATYTLSGQAGDAFRRQTGQEVGEGAIAREAYISKVNNEVLPMLRQTFGAAFTVKEGESLKATLGDPNKSPAEKQTALDSFITAAQGKIESRARRTMPDIKGMTLEMWMEMSSDQRSLFKGNSSK